MSGWAYWFIPGGPSRTPYLTRRLVARLFDLAAVQILSMLLVLGCLCLAACACPAIGD